MGRFVDYHGDTRIEAARFEGPPRHPANPGRASRITTVALVVAFGLGAGWIGGKTLGSRFMHSDSAPVETQPQIVPGGANSTPLSQPDPRNGSEPDKQVSGADTAAPRVEPEVEKPALQPEPHKELPKVPKVDKDEEAEKAVDEPPTKEQTEKEIGSKALDKIQKDNEKMRRGKKIKQNKNEEEQ
ncbi:MAG: hypothetical protein WAV47_22620 [Blastocatellia bacterium]